MPKFIAAFFVGIFLVGSGLGFGFGNEFKALAAHNARPVAPAGQMNFILVRINDRTLDKPELITVWGIFINRSQFPSMIMKQIYPDVGSNESSEIGQSFSLTPDKQPAADFADALNRLDLPSAQVIVIDNDLLPDWISALAGPSILENSPFPASSMNLALAQQVDQQLLIRACATIDRRSQPTALETSNSSEGRVLSNTLTSSDILQQWKGLVTSLHFASCEALVGP